MRVTSGLEPRSLWAFFEDLSAIPRPSFHEIRVTDWLKRFADARGLKWQQDEAGNMVIAKGGMNGGEDAAPVVIQGHLDMVAEKKHGTSHDFMTDPIRLRRDGDWLAADGTTLGADNGIGVAAALALLDMAPASGARLPPLECLFTVAEEVGLAGAGKLDAALLRGRTMLNLDTEEWGSLYWGCAGGGDSTITMPAPRAEAPAAGTSPYMLRIDGLSGGHSGICIHEGRGNAVTMLASLLDEILSGGAAAAASGAAGGEGAEAVGPRPEDAALVSLRGGDKRNAIPREAESLLLLTPAAADVARAAAAARACDWAVEYGAVEKTLRVAFTPAGADTEGQPAGGAASAPPLTAEGARRLVSLLLLLPHGVVKMSHAVEGLVETSSNVAAVTPSAASMAGGGASASFTVLCSTRSSLRPALEATRRRIRAAAAICGAAAVAQPPAYAGWQPNKASPVLAATAAAARRVLGREPKLEAIHAGLECGVIGERVPGMDMVSFGPTIRGAHSPEERVDVTTVEPFWKLVLLTLEELAVSPPLLGVAFSRTAAATAAGAKA